MPTTLQYNNQLTNHIQNISFHVLNTKELVKAVLNITQGIFFSLEKKYINNLESIINKKYSDIIDVFNKSHSKINTNIKHVFNKINTSEQIIKKENRQ